jgi:hypothetical protein
MNDLVSKATFGFVMAQLFPGTIALFAISFSYSSWEPSQPAAVLAAATRVLVMWGGGSVAQQLFLVALSIGAGMLIHGLHWAVLGTLENCNAASIFDVPFHGRRVVLQIAVAPIHAIKEIGCFLIVPKHIRYARMRENVPNIHKDLMPQFQWVQEFYLYSAQFFAHVSYALLIALFALVHFTFLHGVTGRRIVLIAIVYGLIGVMFTLGRVQFASMFGAETDLAERSERLFAKDLVGLP